MGRSKRRTVVVQPPVAAAPAPAAAAPVTTPETSGQPAPQAVPFAGTPAVAAPATPPPAAPLPEQTPVNALAATDKNSRRKRIGDSMILRGRASSSGSNFGLFGSSKLGG